MPATLVQSKAAAQDTGLATVTVTFNGAATAGTLLLLTMGADDYALTSGGSRPESSGWALVTQGAQEGFLGHYLWYKLAAGGETSVSYTIGSAAPSCWVFAEISGVTASPFNTSAGQKAASSVLPYTTPAITPTAGERLLVAAMGWSCHSSNTFTGADTWLNSFTEITDAFTSTAAVTHDLVGLATLAVTANGSTAYSSGASAAMPSGTPQYATGIVAAFNLAAAGATPAATEATGTGAAQTPVAALGVNAGVATGAGIADNPTASAPINASATEAIGAGSALAGLVALAVNAAAATGVGTAEWDPGSSISLDLTADFPVEGQGVAYDATVSTASAVSPAATEAAATGTAYSATAALGVPATEATATGTALDALADLDPSALEAVAAGVALSPAAAITATPPEATAAGAALDATISTSSSVSVPATEAAGSGSAGDVTAAIAPGALEATATGAAFNATTSSAAQTSADAGVASGSGIAIDPVAAVQVLAAAAAAVGTAANAAILAGGDGFVLAGVAEGCGVACRPRGKKITPRPFAGITYRP